MELERFPTLRDADGFTKGYRNPKTFVIEKLNPTEREVIENVTGIAVTFSAGEGAAPYSARFEQMLVSLQALLSAIAQPSAMYVHEHKETLRSKVKSKKGLFFGKAAVLASNRIEIEQEMNSGLSLLAAVVELSASNFRECVDFLIQSFRTFLICPSSPRVFTKEWMFDTLHRKTVRNGWVELDYALLVAHLCRNEQMVVRLACEGDDPSYHVFVRTAHADRVQGVIEAGRG